MFFKDTVTLLSEAAALDIKADTEAKMNRDEIAMACKEMAEVSTFNTAESVLVYDTGVGYYTEMSHLSGFMKDNDIKSVSEALDLVAEANGLEPKEVGLVIESNEILSLLEKAENAKTDKAKAAATNKANKAIKVVKSLEKKGYKVAKKSEPKCSNCGKKKSECECGDASCANPPAGGVINECDDKKK